MFERRPVVYEVISQVEHPEKQNVNTSVAEYLRKYGTGKIDAMPTDPRPEVSDPRSEEEMLADGFEPGLGTDELDVLQQINENLERFQKAREAIEMNQKQRERFDRALAILKDPNSIQANRSEALAILEEMTEEGYVKMKIKK